MNPEQWKIRKIEECARFAFENTYRAWWTADDKERSFFILATRYYVETGTPANSGGKINNEFYTHVNYRAHEITLEIGTKHS
jgi:hypothetical protein